MRALAIAVVTAFAGVAHADELHAADVTAAPLPGNESGRIDGRDESVSPWRVAGRTVLWLPRMVLEIAFAPIRGAVWAYDRYQLGARYKQIFFNDAETVGLYPTLKLDSGYGVTAGGRFVHRDLFGQREHLSARAGTGGRYRQLYNAALRSGQRFGTRAAAEIRGELERRPSDAFYGIGDGAAGIEGRHRQDLMRAWGIVDVKVVAALHVRASTALTQLTYGTSESSDAMERAYDLETLTGFMNGVRHAYGELELRWDSRRAASRWDASVLPATGWLVAAFAGRVHTLQGGADYWRVGGAVQHFIWLGRGPRVLATRLQGERVTGGYADVAFTELPQLGGPTSLRGYPIDRFRDRAAVLGTIEYQWDLNRNLQVSLFVDAGQVMPRLSGVKPDDLRIGYGLGLQVLTGRDFIAQASLATSVDGGVFVHLAFDPIYDIDPRVVRR